MIQRKQTLYSLAVIILFAIMFFVDIAKVTFTTDNATLLKAIGGADGVASLNTLNYYPLTILASLIIIVAVVCIASYKKMALQLRMSIVNLVLILGFIVMEVIAVYRTFNMESNAESTAGLGKFIAESSELLFNNQLGIAAALPLVALIAAYMAFRGISSDIFKLSSFNRMR